MINNYLNCVRHAATRVEARDINAQKVGEMVLIYEKNPVKLARSNLLLLIRH